MGQAFRVRAVGRAKETAIVEADRDPVGILVYSESATGVGGNVVMPRIVGIDPGKTNSLVAIVENGTPKVIPGADGSNLVPSVVYFDERGDVLVGNPAREKM